MIISDNVPMAAVRSPTERFFFYGSGPSASLSEPTKWATYVVFYNERVEGLEERSEGGTEGGRESGNEIPSGSDKHRVVFRGFFRCFLGFVLIRILLADGFLLEDGGGQ